MCIHSDNLCLLLEDRYVVFSNVRQTKRLKTRVSSVDDRYFKEWEYVLC